MSHTEDTTPFDKAAAIRRAKLGGVWPGHLKAALDEIDRLEAQSQQRGEDLNRARQRHAELEVELADAQARICALEAALRKKAMDDHHEKHGLGRPFFADCLYPTCILARQLLGETQP